MTTGLIICGALAREVLALVERHGWDAEVAAVPATFHLFPDRIAPAVEKRFEELHAQYERLICVYGDCGTGGALDAALERLGIERIDGPHCYEWYGGDTFNELMDEEPGTYFLADFIDPVWESILQHFAVDCRLISYDQFCRPPAPVLLPGAKIDWWGALSRSTPNRMWRQQLPDGTARDIWGHVIRIIDNPTGAYEEYATWPLAAADSVADLQVYPWPEPDWWDFAPIRSLIAQYDAQEEYHLRFRIGSVFEIAWQLRGMQEFLMDLANQPEIPQYIMERLTDVYVENTRRVLQLAGDRLDMVYFYDDVATQRNLMISAHMWRRVIKPLHQRIIDVAKSFGKPVMYHCDGALYPLIPELIEMGVDLLNPVQADAAGMDPQRLKDEFGDRLSFHGGIDIIKTLPRGSVQDVRREVADRMRVLGKNGGYILASSHHIQSDTPLENVFAMYDLAGRVLPVAQTETADG